MKKGLFLFLITTSISAQTARDGSSRDAESGMSVPLHVDTLMIMPLGDSITELDWEGGYRSYLYKLLFDEGFDFDLIGTKNNNHNDNNLGFIFPERYWDHEGYNSATITGQSGSTWIWNQHIGDKLASNPPDVVLVLLGTNDLNNGCCTGADVRDQMSAFLDQIWDFDQNITVILGSPPSVRSSTLNNRITDYVSYLPSLVSEKMLLGRKIILADHHAVMNTGTDLVGDGIHPSPQGYRKMAQVWYDAITVNPWTGVDDVPGAPPGVYSLSQNYPNPFNPATSISYTLPEKAYVRLRIFNVLGQGVATLADGEQEPGYRSVGWDASAIPGGVYFYRLTAGPFTGTRKMILMR